MDYCTYIYIFYLFTPPPSNIKHLLWIKDLFWESPYFRYPAVSGAVHISEYFFLSVIYSWLASFNDNIYILYCKYVYTVYFYPLGVHNIPLITTLGNVWPKSGWINKKFKLSHVSCKLSQFQPAVSCSCQLPKGSGQLSHVSMPAVPWIIPAVSCIIPVHVHDEIKNKCKFATKKTPSCGLFFTCRRKISTLIYWVEYKHGDWII